MRRFNYEENDENKENVDKFFNEGQSMEEMTPEEYKQMMAEEKALQEIQIGFAHRDMNQRVLFRAMKMLEKSFWWKFYSVNTCLNKIEETYLRLKELEEQEP